MTYQWIFALLYIDFTVGENILTLEFTRSTFLLVFVRDWKFWSGRRRSKRQTSSRRFIRFIMLVTARAPWQIDTEMRDKDMGALTEWYGVRYRPSERR